MKSMREPTSTYLDEKGYVIGRGLGTRAKMRMHRYVMEHHLGRKLLPTEDVHHIDGDKTNNDISNLEVVTHGEHTLITNSGRAYKNGYTLHLSAAEIERRREWGRRILASANAKRYDDRRLGVTPPPPTKEQLQRRLYAKRYRANRKHKALEKAGGGE